MENNKPLELDKIAFICNRADNTVDAYYRAHDDNLLVNVFTNQEYPVVNPNGETLLSKFGFDRKQVRDIFGGAVLLMMLSHMPVRSYTKSKLYRNYAKNHYKFNMTYGEYCMRKSATVEELKEVCQIITSRRQHVAKKTPRPANLDTMEKD